MIAQVCIEPNPAQGGLYRYVVDFAAIASARTVALCRGHATPLPGRVSVVRIGACDLLPYRSHLTVRAHNALAAALEGAAHVVCHSLYRGHVAAVAAICQDRGVPCSIVAHGMLDPWTLSRYRWLKKSWLRFGGRTAIESASHLLFTTAEEMHKAMPIVPRAKAAILRPAVAAFADRCAVARHAARARLGICSDQRLLVWVGRFDRMKRPLETFRAFVRARVSRTILAVAGYPASVTEASIRRQLADAGARALYLGPVRDEARSQLFSAADGFLSFSYRENFGYSFAESLVHGLPCIVSSGHDLLADVTSHAVGWVADSTTDGWSECIEAFDAAQTHELENIGALNAAWASENLAVDRMRQTIAKLFPAAA